MGNKIFAFLAISLSFYACSAKNPGWTYEKVQGSSIAYTSEKLSFETDESFRSLTLSFVKTNSGKFCFLDAISLPFPVEKEHANQTRITIAAEQTTKALYATRLEGGQRLLLSDETAALLFHYLSNGHNVVISAGRYQGEFPNFFGVRRPCLRFLY